MKYKKELELNFIVKDQLLYGEWIKLIQFGWKYGSSKGFTVD